MRKRSVLFITSFLGSLVLFIYFLGNLIESKKNVDIAKIEYEQSVLETKKVQMEMDQFVNKMIEIGKRQSNPLLEPYLEQLKTANRELNEATNDFHRDPTYENYKKTMLKLEILRNEIKKVFR